MILQREEKWGISGDSLRYCGMQVVDGPVYVVPEGDKEVPAETCHRFVVVTPRPRQMGGRHAVSVWDYSLQDDLLFCLDYVFGCGPLPTLAKLTEQTVADYDPESIYVAPWSLGPPLTTELSKRLPQLQVRSLRAHTNNKRAKTLSLGSQEELASDLLFRLAADRFLLLPNLSKAGKEFVRQLRVWRGCDAQEHDAIDAASCAASLAAGWRDSGRVSHVAARIGFQ